jgi:hypothetical protein
MGLVRLENAGLSPGPTLPALGERKGSIIGESDTVSVLKMGRVGSDPSGFFTTLTMTQ